MSLVSMSFPTQPLMMGVVPSNQRRQAVIDHSNAVNVVDFDGDTEIFASAH